MTSKNKITAYHDRYPKFKLHELGAFYDPETAAYRRDQHHALYATGQVKWTSTVTNKVLLETGFATNIEYLTILAQPGIAQPRYSPGWYTNIGKYDLLTTKAYDGVPAPTYGIFPAKYMISTSASYVTGSHSIKTGSGDSGSTGTTGTSTAISCSSISTARRRLSPSRILL
jgi:hypothetical protein